MKRATPEMYVLDSGALIALEKASPRMTQLLLEVRDGKAMIIVPDGVLAQVWRGGTGRQARVAALLGLKPGQCASASLDTEAAKRIGQKIAECGHSDVIDVQVALIAEDRGAAVVTSDRKDILAVSPGLDDQLVEI